jgi:hypothetical protein
VSILNLVMIDLFCLYAVGVRLERKCGQCIQSKSVLKSVLILYMQLGSVKKRP